jgi:Protein of unknown function (DUF3617)
MLKLRVSIILTYCLFLGEVSTWAQTRKAGLWQVASTTRIQQAGQAPGNFAGSANDQSAPTGGLPVCLTQQMIDTYGVALPPSLKDCELSNVVSALDDFRADITCKGAFTGRGSIETTWRDDDHVVGKVRFVAKSGQGTTGRTMSWIQETTGVFKSPDCGTVQPRKMPEAK